MAFCEQNRFETHPSNPCQDTYYHNNKTETTTQIDYILQQKKSNTISQMSIDERAALNTSPHDALIAELNLILPKWTSNTKEEKPPATRRINWDKIDKLQFEALVKLKLETLHKSGPLPTPIIIDRINNILVDTAKSIAGLRRSP